MDAGKASSNIWRIGVSIAGCSDPESVNNSYDMKALYKVLSDEDRIPWFLEVIQLREP